MSRLQRLGENERGHQPSTSTPHVRLVLRPQAGPVDLETRSARSPKARSILAVPTQGESGLERKPGLRTVAWALGLTALVGGGTALFLLEARHGATASDRATLAAPGSAAPGTSPAPTATPNPTTPNLTSPTVLSAREPVAATNRGATFATYSVAGGSINVEVTATAPCWIDVQTAPTGPSVFTGTLAPGQQEAFSNVGSLWLRVGYAAGLRVVANGTAIPLPANSDPYDLTFNQINQTTPPVH